jgi:hypothetical protein
MRPAVTVAMTPEKWNCSATPNDRIDAADGEVLELTVERRGNVGRRVGGAQVNVVTARRQLRGDRCCDGRLSHATLAHDHHEATTGRRDLLDE